MFHKVLVKPENPQISSLAITTDTRYIDDMAKLGACYYGKHDYHTRSLRDTPLEELYWSNHFIIPQPLVSRLALPEMLSIRKLLKRAEWAQEAKDHYNYCINLSDKIREITLNVNGVNVAALSILRDAGIDPESLPIPLMPHQLQALALYIKLKFSNNWGQMRTGKTPPTLVYAYWLLTTKQIDLALFVVPNSIKRVWYKELPRFIGPVEYPESIHFITSIIEGTKKKKTELWNDNSLIKIVNYECLRADIDIAQKSLQDQRFLLVLDEAHNVKNSDAKQTIAAKSLKPEFFIALSGTPVANKPHDVYEPISMTCPSLLGSSFTDFRREFCKVGGYTGKDITGYKDGALPEISKRMKTISIRALRKDVTTDFGKVVQPQELIMSPTMKNIHDQINAGLRTELQTAVSTSAFRVAGFLPRLVRLQQITAGFVPMFDSNDKPTGEVLWLDDKDNTKLKWLDKFLKDYLDDLGKVVIFCRFIPVIKKLAERYRCYGSTYVCGEIKDQERVNRVSAFQSDPKVKILIVNIQIASGLDMNPDTLPPLAKSQVSIFYERVFYLMLNTQAEDRITGINQKAEATIIPLVCKGSIDDRLENIVLPRKRKWADAVMGEGDAEISDEDLEVGLKITQRDLFDLVG